MLKFQIEAANTFSFIETIIGNPIISPRDPIFEPNSPCAFDLPMKTDDETEVIYPPKKDGNFGPFEFTGITIDALVERLTCTFEPEEEIYKTIIYTFRSYTDTKTLIAKFCSKMHIQATTNTKNAHSSALSKLKSIQFVAKWISTSWSPDFTQSDSRNSLEKFLKCITCSETLYSYFDPYFFKISSYMNCLVHHLEKKHLFLISLPPALPTAEKGKEVALLDCEIDDICNALATKDNYIFCKLKPIDFLSRLWSKSDNESMIETRSVNRAIDSFNTTCFWVATEICTQPELKNRAKTIEMFIRIAKKCKRMHQYNALMAIISGLNLVSVSRLRNTWDAVEQKRQKDLAEIESFMSPQFNYKMYRSALDDLGASEFKVPVLSIFLKDLQFTHDGNPTILKEDPKIINFDKMRTISAITSVFVDSNRTKLSEQDFGTSYKDCYFLINNMRALNESQLYKYSTLCEPKASDNENLRLREKWMNET